MENLEQWGVKGITGADYEFRFLSDRMTRAVHVVRLSSDAEACARAHAYLEASPEFETVVVRSGHRFMQEIVCADRAVAEKPMRRLSS